MAVFFCQYHFNCKFQFLQHFLFVGMSLTQPAPWFAVPGNILVFSLAHNLIQVNITPSLQFVISS